MGIKIQAISVLGIALVVAFYTELVPFRSKNVGTDVLDDEYDYVIVGGGSAGSVLAARLSEDKDSRVLLLEAGGSYQDQSMFHIPLLNGMFYRSEYDWEYFTEPQKVSGFGLNDQKQFWPRGRVLGGSSVINSLQYTRGNRLDYDEWEKDGCTGWSYKDVLPYFRKSEDMRIPRYQSSPYHNKGGPLAVSEIDATQMADIYVKAGEELGYKVTDYNGREQAGFSKMQLNVRNGVRSSVGLEYLGKVYDRVNLHIGLRSLVTKIEIQNKKAVGVYYIRNGKRYFVKSKKEVIISGGAINSPQLLMLSGLGPKDHLEPLGIPVVANLPVGQNFQDHPIVFMHSNINKPYGLTQQKVESFWTVLKYYLFGTGMFAISGIEACAFLHINQSEAKETSPDIQYNFFSGIADRDYFNIKQSVIKEYMAENANTNGFSTVVIVAHPKSRGSVKLRSKDPFDYPVLEPNYLAEKEDVEKFIAGIRIWEKLVQTPTMKDLGVDINRVKLSFCSQHDFRSDAYWECFVRHLALTSHHQSCTCKMGARSDPSAVVDPELKVIGIDSLRVVDASVFPNLMAGNTNAPVIMVAEKAADMIRGIDSVEKLRTKL